MRVKNVKLEWYVIEWEPNRKEVVNVNIFHKNYVEMLHKEIVKKKTITNYNQLKEFIRKDMMGAFWCRCEHEIAVGHFPAQYELKYLKKIDSYWQIAMNLDRIIEYVIRTCDIKFKEE